MCIRRAVDHSTVSSRMANDRNSNPNITISRFIHITEPNITKDNPAFSMINDSDEDVVYGSDDESRRPLNSAGKGNDYDSD